MEYYIDKHEAMEKCMKFMENLAELLKDQYTFGKSPIATKTLHLVPNGTEDENTYYSKPLYSFRCSDHWNWYANTKKCSNYWYIQCYNEDVFWAEKRKGTGATKPVYCTNVSFFGYDQKFHCVYGEKFDRKTKTYSWIESDPKEVAEMALNLLKEQEEADLAALERISETKDFATYDSERNNFGSGVEELKNLNHELNNIAEEKGIITGEDWNKALGANVVDPGVVWFTDKDGSPQVAYVSPYTLDALKSAQIERKIVCMDASELNNEEV